MPSTNPVMVAYSAARGILADSQSSSNLQSSSRDISLYFIYIYININPSFNSIFVYLSQITLSTQFLTHLMLFGFGGVFCCLVDRLGFFVGARMKVVVL